MARTSPGGSGWCSPVVTSPDVADRLIDITVALQGGVPVYPGDTPLTLERVQARAEGAPANVSRLECSTHLGTHVDAPVHFLEGEGGIETVALDSLLGRTYVIDARAIDGDLDAPALGRLAPPADAERLLFRTRNEVLWERPRFVEEFVSLTPDGARALVDRGTRLVGIDYLSIAPYRDPATVHEILLRGGVTIVETLDLRRTEPGWYDLICLPLLLVGADGAPARAALKPLAGG